MLLYLFRFTKKLEGLVHADPLWALTQPRYGSQGCLDPDTVGPREAFCSSEVLPDVPPEVLPEILPDIHPDVLPEVLPDVHPEVLPDIRPDVHPDVLPEVRPDVHTDIHPDVLPEVRPEVLPDVHPEVLPEVRPDVPPVVLPDVLPEAVCEEERRMWRLASGEPCVTSGNSLAPAVAAPLMGSKGRGGSFQRGRGLWNRRWGKGFFTWLWGVCEVFTWLWGVREVFTWLWGVREVVTWLWGVREVVMSAQTFSPYLPERCGMCGLQPD